MGDYTGGKAELLYVKHLASGAFGSVHQVPFGFMSFVNRDVQFLDTTCNKVLLSVSMYVLSVAFCKESCPSRSPGGDQ